jgi:hypothetical protein
MTLDKHQIDGIGGFSSKVLPADQFEESLSSAGYTIAGSAPAKGEGLKFGGHMRLLTMLSRFTAKTKALLSENSRKTLRL